MNLDQANAVVLAWAGTLQGMRLTWEALGQLANLMASEQGPARPVDDHCEATTTLQQETRRQDFDSGAIVRELVTVAKSAAGGACTHNGCGRPRFCKGLCTIHYERQRRGAPMDAPLGPLAKDLRPPTVGVMALDNPTLLTRAMVVKNAKAAQQRSECGSFARCSIIAKRKPWRKWSCAKCGGSSSDKKGG